MALCGYDYLCAKGGSLFTNAHPYRLNATVFGFAPDIIFSVDSAAKRAIAISAVTSAIGLVLNFWYQFLYSGATAAKFQVCASFCIFVFLNTESSLAHTRPKPAIPLTATFSSAFAVDSRVSSC